MPWNTPFRNAPELPGGSGLSNVTVVVALAEIVKVKAFEVPPPGAGLNTVIDAVPAVAMSGAAIAAVSCEDEPKVVVRLPPFHRTTDPLMKFVPRTVSVNAAPPAAADVGVRLVVVGTGFGADEMVKTWAFEVPPPGAGLNTVIDAVPAVAMSAAAIAAVSCEDEPKVVVRLPPFHRTTDPLMKFVPPTVSVNAAPPAAADVGVRLVVVGTGFGADEMVKTWAFEVPPPGAGLNTVIDAVPAVAMSAAAIAAVSCEDEPKVVVRLPPFHRTTDPLMKFVPPTVSVNA